LESQSESEQIELYEEKLKLIEAELLCSQQRADIAESQGIYYCIFIYFIIIIIITHYLYNNRHK